MKLCLVEQRFTNKRITGPSKHIRELAEAISNSGQEVMVICEQQKDEAASAAEDWRTSNARVRVHELEGLGFGNYKVLKNMWSVIKKEKPDIVHVQGYRNAVTDTAALYCCLNRIPFVITPRGSLLGFERRKTDTMIPVAIRLYDILSCKFALRVADRIVASSEMERRDALRMSPNGANAVVIPHGMKSPPHPSRQEELPGNPRILTVSRITKHRNVLEIVESMHQVLRAYPEAVLYVVGDPISYSRDSIERQYPGMVKRISESTLLDGHVKLMGGLYGNQLWRLYASCDVFAYASSYDNFGFGLLEAAHFGLPILSTDVGIARQLVGTYEGGTIIQDATPATIGTALIGLLGRIPKEGGAMSNHLRHAASTYSIEKNRDAHLKLYDELIRNEGAKT